MYSFSLIIQVLINGILLGCMYGVAALGLSLIFGSMRIIFIAQGSMLILAAYMSFWIFKYFGLDPFLSLILTIPAFMVLGWAMYWGMFRRIANSPNSSIILAFGIMAFLENGMSVLWSPSARAVGTSYAGQSLAFLGLNISISRLMVFCLCIIVTLIVYLFLKKTMWGKAVRSAALDMKACALMGASPLKISALTFAIGIGLAAIAGACTSVTFAFDPYFGFIFSTKAMIAVAFGGLGNVPGAVVGGIILGVLEALGAYFISPGMADAVAYIAFLLVLIFMPEGLFGRSVKKA